MGGRSHIEKQVEHQVPARPTTLRHCAVHDSVSRIALGEATLGCVRKLLTLFVQSTARVSLHGLSLND